MHTFKLADAKAHLSHLIELVEAGEEVTITKRGRAVVRLVASLPPRQQLPSLAEFRAKLPQQSQPAGDFMRIVREGDRY
ncbi:type II toxin-antitoxin system Phd/YefM family antitoxin [Chitinimonas arctica]|uniref:Antitoxin n=1 Tax=Chitinimonas arctica TaxID=2594795 RepID=A0A516SK33_9NEIS|nr:type II toxin-antitoxin system prevent-host-death family antitoxin [Chitinimonas arctica]QDQ28522.1 type II toxin-antitoxin system Phd/YefM family antitoxin [Chitinimonas arctica]